MALQPPFQFAESLVRQLLTRLQPPAWVVDEVQRRIVLLLNHVLMQEKAATERLARRQGSVLRFEWQVFSMRLLVTPAGLLDLATPDATPDLSLSLSDPSAVAIVQSLLRGDKPAVRIDGDVQLAAEVSWLVDHVRWDLEEDLARLMGDAPAHRLGQVVRSMVEAVRRFAGTGQSGTTGGAGAAP